MAGIPKADITKAAAYINTRRCSDEPLSIDDAVIKKNSQKKDSNNNVVEVEFWGHHHVNYTVVGNEACTFTVNNKLEGDKPIEGTVTEENPDGEFEEGAFMGFGGVSFMFNEGLKILVSEEDTTGTEKMTNWSESKVEQYEEVTEEKLGQIFITPAKTRRFVLINLEKDAKKISIFLGGAVSSLAFMAGSLTAAFTAMLL